MRKMDSYILPALLWIGCSAVWATLPTRVQADPGAVSAGRGRAVHQENPARGVYKKIVPSLVTLVALDVNNQPLGEGSGFYIKPHLVATNLHVIRDARSLRVWEAATHKSQKCQGILAVSPEHDLAVLQMVESGPPLPLAGVPLEVGDTVYALGNPIGLEATLSSGIVSGLRKLGKTTMYQVTAPISPGSSGGPVVNARSEVVGISTSYLLEGQNLNFAVDVRNLTALLASSSGKSVQPFSYLSTLAPDPEGEHISALKSLHITAPTVGWGHSPDRREHGLNWNLSVKNEGDRAVKNVDLLILIFDRQSKDMIHYVRKKLPISIPGKLAKRMFVDAGTLDFDTDEADSKWTFEYRILGFDYAPSQEP